MENNDVNIYLEIFQYQVLSKILHDSIVLSYWSFK